MSIGIETLVSVIIFFIAVIFLILAFVKKPKVKEDTIGWDIVEQIKITTEESIKKMDEKMEAITDKEKEIKKMYDLIISEGKHSRLKIEPKKSPMDDKKIEIYRLHNQGVPSEKISEMLSIHKGIVETVLSLKEHESNTL